MTSFSHPGTCYGNCPHYVRRRPECPGAIRRSSGDESSGTSFPDWTSGAPRIVSDGTVEDQAVDALRRISAYLMSLKTIGLVSKSSPWMP